jgi:hypothetical protein
LATASATPSIRKPIEDNLFIVGHRFNFDCTLCPDRAFQALYSFLRNWLLGKFDGNFVPSAMNGID